jgi:Cu-Zn family superoxide dismutase
MYLPTTAALLLTTAVAACMGKPHHHFKAEPVKAVAAFNGMNNVTGSIQFVQDSPHSPTYIIANLTGVPAGEHGLHIHQLGDLTNGMLDREFFFLLVKC